MVLYHVITLYHLLCAVVQSVNVKEEKVLLLPTWIISKLEQRKYLDTFFDNIIYYDPNYYFINDKKKSEQYITSLIGNIQDYSQKYIWGANYTFGIYLAENRLQFIYCEEAAGLLSFPERLEMIDAKSRIKAPYIEKIKDLGLYDGSAEAITSVMCNLYVQKKEILINKPIIDFDPVKELTSCSEKDKACIINIFSTATKVIIPDHSICILTQHFANLGILSFEEQCLIYQLFIDYFFQGDNIIIKPHPDDILYYRKLIDAEIIKEKFPTELLPIITDKRLKGIATISSTATLNLRRNNENIFELDERFEKDFKYLHRYYFATQIGAMLDKQCVSIYSNEKIIEKLCAKDFRDSIVGSIENPQKYHNCLIIIDNIGSKNTADRNRIITFLEEVPNSACVVFINSQMDYCWYDYYKKNIWEQLIPVIIRKRTEKKDCFENEKAETIFLFTKNKLIQNMVREMKIQKELTNTGIEIEMENLSKEQEKIAILEGILAATENRLLYYIKKEKEKE